MKSILFIIPNLGGGGAEKVLVNLANKLDRNKFTVEIRTLFNENANRHFLNKDIKINTCFGRQFRGNRILFKLFTPEFLFKRLIKNKYDIIVSFLEGPGERIVAGCSNPQTRLVNWIHVEQHTIEVASSSYRSVREYSRYANRFDYTAFVSQTVKDDYLSFTNIAHPCGVIYNTNDTESILQKSKEPIPDGELPKGFNIFSIGRLTYAKGFDRLIKAHKTLREKGYNQNLIILGDGELKENLIALTRSLGVEDSVYLLGFKENPYKYLTYADLFVCSSRREGFSTAVTEALILGIPVVSTLCSGAEELIGKNGEYGIICENSTDGVLQGLSQMLATPSNLKEYREKALIRGREFSADKTIAQTEKLFDML